MRWMVLWLALAVLPGAGVFEKTRLPAPEGRVNHAPGIVALPSGGVLVCWYSGTTEANADTVILCSTSTDKGASWAAARVVAGPAERAVGADELNKSLGNVALGFDAAGRLWMIHGVVQRWSVPVLGNLCMSWSCGRVDARISLDEGQSWSVPVRLDNQSGALPRSRPLHHPTLGDLVPLYLETAHTAYVRVLDLASLHPGEVPQGRVLAIPAEDVIQPSLVLRPDGAVWAYLRDHARTAIRFSRLDPLRQVWTPGEATDLPNPDSGLDAFTDDAGHVVLVHNPSTVNRNALALAASADGLRFPWRCPLVPEGREGEVAYPAAMRAADGSWHVAYSAQSKAEIRHLRFDAAWLGLCLGLKPVAQ